ncbi:GNAT family N-acetyltransferase [Agrococcus jejuensis]|uniref:GNAT family N-acetyltransferase n=1 Tax=Agrococcus jejuensis TaxID=399736 RepID=UPI0011AA2D37|nr:GNAT family N-acetyltransferase [Agrococcus jejuensis]
MPAIALDASIADDVVAFLDEHLADMRSVSPPESVHALDVAALRAPGIRLWVLRGDDGGVQGTVALAPLEPGHVELKSMRVSGARRGAGLGRLLLDHVLAEARASGATRVSLETGAEPYFAAARGLYARGGFAECAPFGSYVLDPSSVFMTRTL